MGKDLDEPIGQKMIYTGENTSGKSKRSKAIALCLIGFIPFSAKTGKKGADILSDYGDGAAIDVPLRKKRIMFDAFLDADR